MQEENPEVQGYFLEVKFDSRFNTVIITASDEALVFLQSEIQRLMDFQGPGEHIHIEQALGNINAGNVEELTFVRTGSIQYNPHG